MGKPCKHDPPQCLIGSPFRRGQDCMICWLYHNNDLSRSFFDRNGHAVKSALALAERNKRQQPEVLPLWSRGICANLKGRVRLADGTVKTVVCKQH